MVTRQVEHLERSRGTDLHGPHPHEATARRALDIAKKHTRQADAAGRARRDQGAPAGMADPDLPTLRGSARCARNWSRSEASRSCCSGLVAALIIAVAFSVQVGAVTTGRGDEEVLYIVDGLAHLPAVLGARGLVWTGPFGADGAWFGHVIADLLWPVLFPVHRRQQPGHHRRPDLLGRRTRSASR